MRRPRLFRILLTAEDCDRLYTICRRRDLKPEPLLTTLLQVILRDNLVNAVIDDEPIANSPSPSSSARESVCSE
jgi:hypothetical protein